jgi:hypothetical protein
VLHPGPANAQGIARVSDSQCVAGLKSFWYLAFYSVWNHRKETLDRAVSIPPRPLLPNSPQTEANAGGAITITALCQAALTRSDNTAANLLLESIGGPAGFTAFRRSIGDSIARLDRYERSSMKPWPVIQTTLHRLRRWRMT